MGALTLQRSRERLTRELTAWQAGAIGLICLSVMVNTALTARITDLEAQRQTDAALYQEQIGQAERIRDLAVRELGAMSLRQAEEAEARAAQAAAYEAVGVYEYIGECRITYYCPCEKCCGKWADGLTATGLPAVPGIVAVDKDVIPLGSTVIIDGQKYLAADTGVKGMHVDVCLPDHGSTVEAGAGTAEVWVESTCT